MAEKKDGENSKVFVGLYITFCVLFITWLTTKFFKGRRQVHQAFHVIEEQLQRMQDQLDKNKDDDDRMLEFVSEDDQKNKKEGVAATAESEPESDKLKCE